MVNRSRRPFTAELRRSGGAGGSMAMALNPPVADLPDDLGAGMDLPLQQSEGEPALIGATGTPVDNTEILTAISELKQRIESFIKVDQAEIEQIQTEIADIAGRIRATKAEIAAIRHPLSPDDKFNQATTELSEVVSATEGATNTIMDCVEELEEIVGEVQAQLPEGYQLDRLHDMGDVILRIMESCNFQDLTGQRITKVVRTLTFIEERVDAMLSLWNQREFEAMPLPPAVSKLDGELELHGPDDQEKKDVFSQADIDALFD